MAGFCRRFTMEKSFSSEERKKILRLHVIKSDYKKKDSLSGRKKFLATLDCELCHVRWFWLLSTTSEAGFVVSIPPQRALDWQSQMLSHKADPISAKTRKRTHNLWMWLSVASYPFHSRFILSPGAFDPENNRRRVGDDDFNDLSLDVIRFRVRLPSPYPMYFSVNIFPPPT